MEIKAWYVPGGSGRQLDQTIVWGCYLTYGLSFSGRTLLLLTAENTVREHIPHNQTSSDIAYKTVALSIICPGSIIENDLPSAVGISL